MKNERNSAPLHDGEKKTLFEKRYPEVEVNLNNFALFLSVMRIKKAYQNTLSIIMEEPDIQIREICVEKVVLNKSGKKAIRLDAWAMTEDDRHFDMEMENRANRDSLPKRTRYYQSLMDAPILKAGKDSKYRELPTTVIIFITQEDIFGRDLAKYTFTEQCEEVEDLKLEDGTTKIFLNMTSKNGSPELISLLQYMKETNLDNPEISVKDKRLLELDEIVSEVKESEEWEALEMDILDYGLEKGRAEGRAEVIGTMIKACQKVGVTKAEMINLIKEEFGISETEADKCIEEYWK